MGVGEEGEDGVTEVGERRREARVAASDGGGEGDKEGEEDSGTGEGGGEVKEVEMVGTSAMAVGEAAVDGHERQ